MSIPSRARSNSPRDLADWSESAIPELPPARGKLSPRHAPGPSRVDRPADPRGPEYPRGPKLLDGDAPKVTVLVTEMAAGTHGRGCFRDFPLLCIW